jgi:hypothetical protein
LPIVGHPATYGVEKDEAELHDADVGVRSREEPLVELSVDIQVLAFAGLPSLTYPWSRFGYAALPARSVVALISTASARN